MKTTFLTLTALALLGTGAFAKDRCNPATGNWLHAATITCPDQGSGGVGYSHTVRTKCETRK